MFLSVAVLLTSAAVADFVALAPDEPEFAVWPPASTTLPANGHLLIKAADRVLITHGDGSVEDLVPGDPVVDGLDGAYATVTPTLTEGEVISLEAVCSTCGTEPLEWVVGPVDVDAPVFEGEPPMVQVNGAKADDFDRLRSNSY
jgi:hypothetical protein